MVSIPKQNAGKITSTCIGNVTSFKYYLVNYYNDSEAVTIHIPYNSTHYHFLLILRVWMYVNANIINTSIIMNSYINETLNPTCIILIGINMSTASKSSKMTCSLALLNTQDIPRPAAFSILKSNPPDVGAANLATIKTSFQIVNSSLATGSVYLKYTEHNSQGRSALSDEMNYSNIY
eukprot:Mrub_04401.p2 GENE.Mrub_04401~~Mrub_04401.p2  ORF type:complete len:178 (+),score=15.44 Mrub_04401:134-667(+)